MKPKDKIECWACKKVAMVLAPELGGEWYRCTNCSATYFAGKMEFHDTGLHVEYLNEKTLATKYKPRARRLSKKSSKVAEA